jgi:hypothetical protein
VKAQRPSFSDHQTSLISLAMMLSSIPHPKRRTLPRQDALFNSKCLIYGICIVAKAFLQSPKPQ